MPSPKLRGVASAGVRVEDVATTGGSTLQAVQTLREAGFDVQDVLVLADRMEGAKETLETQGLKSHRVFDRHVFF